MTWNNHTTQGESDLSNISYYHDNTSYVLISATSLETAGAANTAVGIVDLSKWAENTLYINCSGGPGANAGTSGLIVTFSTRPASGIPWAIFRTETAVDTSSLSILNIVGSGIAASSGVTHFGDVRIHIENITADSGTATLTAWMKSRTPR